MKKYLLVILVIVCIAVLLGFFVAGSETKEKKDNAVQNKTTSTNNSFNNTNNVKINNNVNQVVNNVQKNEIENNVKEAIENITNNVNSQIENKNTTEVSKEADSHETNTSVEDPNLEKAISIAKQEWGEDDSVYYTDEGKTGEYYLIGVRDKSTTSVQLYYKVDVNNNTAEIEW